MKTATHNRFEVLSISFSKKWALILVFSYRIVWDSPANFFFV